MSGFIDYDAGTIIFNLVAFSSNNGEQRNWYLSILKRRFYEWEQHIMKLGYVKHWRGVNNETINPDEWTKAIFEVFWNECLRDVPNLGIPHPSLKASEWQGFFSRKPYDEIKQLLLESILKPDQ